MLEKALKTQYGISELAGTEPADYSWTADALGIRFYFNSHAVSKEKRREIGDYSNHVITIALPYDVLEGAMVGKLSEAPDAYIARIDRETVYRLPHGNLSIMLTKNDAGTLIRMMLRNGRSHDGPARIQFYSAGLPATNEPSKQLPITVYLTKIQ